jgi:integrase
MLDSFLLPKLGDVWINDIKAVRLYEVLREIESRGIRETAHRARSLASRVFRFAVATGRAERDVTADLRGALAPIVTKNRAAIIEPRAIGKLLRAIDEYDGQPATGIALRLSPYVFVRPGELRGAQWSEIDWDAREWRIPPERMKMREQHIVPLARQVIALLEELRPITEYTGFLFPSLRSTDRPMSNNTVNAALRRLGYSTEEMTGHGFRALACTRLNEQGWHPDLIELQLAHAERNRVRAAYNRAQRFQERRKMMQEWADYIDALRLMGEDSAREHKLHDASKVI